MQHGYLKPNKGLREDPFSFSCLSLRVRGSVRPCVSMLRPGHILGVLGYYPQEDYLTLLRQGILLSWCPQFRLEQVVGEHQGSVCILRPVAEIEFTQNYAQYFYVSSRNKPSSSIFYGKHFNEWVVLPTPPISLLLYGGSVCLSVHRGQRLMLVNSRSLSLYALRRGLSLVWRSLPQLGGLCSGFRQYRPSHTLQSVRTY